MYTDDQLKPEPKPQKTKFSFLIFFPPLKTESEIGILGELVFPKSTHSITLDVGIMSFLIIKL